MTHDITTKVSLFPGHSCPHEFPLGHLSHCPGYDFGPDHNWDLLRVGHGQYDQQQDVFIITFIPVICRLTIMYPRYGMAEPPVPSSSNSQPRRWTSRVKSSQNPELILQTWAPKSINAVTFCPSMTDV